MPEPLIHNKFIFRNAQIIDTESIWNGRIGNLVIGNGLIRDFLPSNEPISDDIPQWKIDGYSISAGWVDSRVSGIKSIDDFLSSALKGGFTDVFYYPQLPIPSEDPSYIEGLNQKFNTQIIDIHLILPLTQLGKGTSIAPYSSLNSHWFGDGLSPVLPEILLRALQYQKSLANNLLIECPQYPQLTAGSYAHEGYAQSKLGLPASPAFVEPLAAHRSITLLQHNGGNLLLGPISLPETLREVLIAQQRLSPQSTLSAEVSVPYLCFNDESLMTLNPVFKLTPPLRDDFSIEKMRQMIVENPTVILSSGHQIIPLENKKLPFFDALGGLQLAPWAVPLAYAALGEKLPIDIFLKMVTTIPRKVFGLPEIKIEKGFPAKLTVFKQEKIEQNYSPASLLQNFPGFNTLNLPISVKATLNNQNLTRI